MDPSLDGQFAFGTACHVVHTPHRAAIQKDAHFGISGVAALAGGTRGRTFHVHGLFVGPDLFSVVASEGILLSFVDGLVHTLVDTQGRAWQNVIFEGEYQPSPEGPRPTDFGWCLPYSCTLTGLG